MQRQALVVTTSRNCFLSLLQSFLPKPWLRQWTLQVAESFLGVRRSYDLILVDQCFNKESLDVAPSDVPILVFSNPDFDVIEVETIEPSGRRVCQLFDLQDATDDERFVIALQETLEATSRRSFFRRWAASRN